MLQKCVFRHSGNVILLVSQMDLFWVPPLQPLGFLKQNCALVAGFSVVDGLDFSFGNMFLASREVQTMAVF